MGLAKVSGTSSGYLVRFLSARRPARKYEADPATSTTTSPTR